MMKKAAVIFLVLGLCVPVMAKDGPETKVDPGKFVDTRSVRVLNEVAPNSLDWGQDIGEWFELRNPSSGTRFDVAGLQVADNHHLGEAIVDVWDELPTHPSTVIPPGGFAIVMDVKEQGGYSYGETYDAVIDYIYEQGMENDVIILGVEGDAIGDGLADDDDEVRIYGTAHVQLLGEWSGVDSMEWWVPVYINNDRFGWSRAPYESYSWQNFSGAWVYRPWTPGSPNDGDAFTFAIGDLLKAEAEGGSAN